MTKNCGVDNSKFIDALNSDLEHEMSSIVRYLHHSFMVRGPIRGPLCDMFRNKAKSSMTHAIALGEKICALGGHPSVKINTIIDPVDGESTRKMIELNLKAELRHLEMYMNQHRLFEDDTPLRQLIEKFILEEANHIEELEMYLREDPDTSNKPYKSMAKVK